MTKILLADEIGLYLELEKSFLKRAGCQVLTASTGTEAVQKARSMIPDLILLDAQLSDMDGVACCRAIRSDPATRGVPVFFVTAPAEAARCAEAGGDGFVAKPVTRARLLEAVRRFVPLVERASERLPVALKVEYSRAGSGGSGFTRDLGVTGIFLNTHEALDPGEALDLSFSLPVASARPIRAFGQVVRVARAGEGSHHAPGVGIHFRALSARSRLEISRFLRERTGGGT